MQLLPRLNPGIFERAQRKSNGELPELLDIMQCSENPLQIKNTFLSIMQLYYDGLVSLQSGERHWPIQHQTLERLLEAGRECIGNFYGGYFGCVEDVKEKILPIAGKIKKYGSKKESKTSHLVRKERDIYNFGLRLPKWLESVDVIVPVASEGFEPGLLLSDIYEDTTMFPMRFSRLREEEDNVKLAGYITEEDIQQQINQKNVLVVEGTVDSGYSMYRVAEFVQQRHPSKLYVACVRGIPTNEHDLNIAVSLITHKFVDGLGSGFLGEVGKN